MPKPPKTALLLFFFAGAVFLFCWVHRIDLHEWWLEDLPVYTSAVGDWLAARDPYSPAHAPLYFLYPPAFLVLAGLLSHLTPTGWGSAVYVCAEIAAVLALPIILARFFMRQAWLTPLFAVLLFLASPRFTGALALCSANVASLLYLAAFTAAIPGLRRNHWALFYLAVVLAGIIKIPMLSLLLLPLLAGRRQWVQSICCGVAVVAVNLAERIFLPGFYAGYQWSLVQAIVKLQRYGYGVFGILASNAYKVHHEVGKLPYAVAGLMATAIVVGLFLLRRRIELTTDPAANGNWLALVVMAIVLINPRTMVYDMDIALFAAFILLVYAFRIRRVLLLMTALFLPAMVTPHFIGNTQLKGMYETFVVLAAFVFGFSAMWRESRLLSPHAA